MRHSPTLPLLAIVAVAALGCGGGPPSIASPRRFCEALADTWCARFYDCYTADQIAAAGLPKSKGECTRELELDLGCDEVTETSACPDGFALDLLAAAACVDDLNTSVCSRLPDRTDVGEQCADACLPVDGPDTCDPVPCDPADPLACGTGAACRLDAECVALCVDDAGAGGALDPCDDDGDCASGYRCADSGLCTELCDADNPCGAGRVCGGPVHADAGVRECSDGCIPGRDDCPAGMTCGLDSATTGETYCVPAGTGLEGATCTDSSDCRADLFCSTTEAGGPQCMLGCDHDNLCADGRTCYGWTPAVMIGAVTLGRCQ